MKHIPRKRFGQNFLKDESIIDAIVQCISPQKTDLLVEIGPGLGALTKKCMPYLNHMHAVELDRDLAEHLRKTFTQEQLTLYQADALKFDFSSIVNQQQKLRVIGNLPYNISSPLLFHLTDFAHIIKDQHFMLQKEVVERMIASPGTKAFGRLSVMLQYRYDMEMLFIVPPESFTPAPKVDSAIVRMIPKENLPPCDINALSLVATQAFSQRRKMLRNNLAPLFSEDELIKLGINPTSRPEALELEQFILLAQHCPHSSL